MKKIWQMIIEQIYLITKVKLIVSPQVFLLNMIVPTRGKITRNPKLIVFLIVAASVVTAAYWKKASTPSCTERINKVWYMIFMHKLTTIIKIREGDGKAKFYYYHNTWK